jgi:hypothetical protein
MEKKLFRKNKLFTSIIQAAFFWWIALAFPTWCVQNLDFNGFFQKVQVRDIDTGSLFYTETKEFSEAFQYFQSRPLK